MPRFADSAETSAPPEEVWKLLYDPSRFPEWWAGIERVVSGGDGGGYTMFPDGYPDFPMPQQLETHREERSVRISCLVSDLHYDWRLEETEHGTRIAVDVEIPEQEAHRLETQREVAAKSLRNLALLSASSSGAGTVRARRAP
jgi:uncharacterized protein YndB with AHSA1/START domain